jgi:putative ABC transport system permease protein
VRTGTGPASLIADVRQTVRGLDAGLPLSSVATIDELIADSLQQPRSLTLLVGSLATIALLLSVIGIYGVMAYYVQQQLKEISIRLALGASRGDVLGLVLRQGMTVVAGGLAAGMAVALLAGRWMTSLLFGVTPADAVPLAGVAALLLSVALAACFVPARRATALQPAIVLRND